MDKSKNIKGRGATRNPSPRYLDTSKSPVDDGWSVDPIWEPEFLKSDPATRFYPDKTKNLITTNQSPDIPFEQSINPYKGCEFGCVYCYARPTHAYLDLSPGLDFETKIFFKTNPVERLREALENPNYKCKTIALGTNTDPYQPIEKQKRITRQVLETLLDYRHPVSIVTKGTLILRDLDLLQEFARQGLLSVGISITTLSTELKTKMEPRSASPTTRIRVVQTLAESNIRVGVMVAPIIPMLNDQELESIVTRATDCGARFAGYVMIRLPLEVEPIFVAWLNEHYPLKAERIMNRIKDMRGGQAYRSGWGTRMRGVGPYADMIAKRFEIIKRKCGILEESGREKSQEDKSTNEVLDRVHDPSTLRTDLFRRPLDQLPLFR